MRKVMRWKAKPKLIEGNTRTIKRFLFFPRCINKEWRWLEFASIDQKAEYVCVYANYMGKSYELGWVDQSWANEYTPDSVSYPGKTVLDYMSEQDLALEDLARILKMDIPHLTSFLAGKIPVTKNMATELSKLFNTSPIFWLNRQKIYDEFKKAKD